MGNGNKSSGNIQTIFCIMFDHKLNINAFCSTRQFMLIMLLANSLVLCSTFNMNYPWLWKDYTSSIFKSRAWTMSIITNILLIFIYKLGYTDWCSL